MHGTPTEQGLKKPTREPYVEIIAGLFKEFAESLGSNATSLAIPSGTAGKIIAAAGVPLTGWLDTVDPSWLAVDENELAVCLIIMGARVVERRIAQSLAMKPIPASTFWRLTSDGKVFRVTHNENAAVVGLIESSYSFDDGGALVRTLLRDHASGACNRERTLVRRPDATSKVTKKEAVAAVAALLREFDNYRFALRNPMSLSRKRARQVEIAGRRLLPLIRAPENCGMHRFGSKMLAAVLEQFLARLSAAREETETRPPLDAARTHFMGPLQDCFRLLFGAPATTRFRLEDNGYRADGPFIRLASAFFEGVGYPCEPNTINSSLRDWRRENGFARVRPSKP